jgi:uncharacterized damage-inducible protein DinB
MDPILERVRTSLGWDAWANREMVLTLGRAPVPSAVRWMAHVLAARRLWLDRLEGRGPTAPVWPDWDLEEVVQELERCEATWTAWLAPLAPVGLERSIEYVNSRGQAFTSRVEDVLTHVVLHGAHHRGQAASALREAGVEAPPIDFIHARRTGLVPG